MNKNIKHIGLIKKRDRLCHSLFWGSTGNALFWGETKWFIWHMPVPFLTAKPNLFVEPSSLPLQELENPLLLRFVLFGLRADFSISSRLSAPVGAYVLQEVLLSTPKFPTLLYGFIFLLSLSFLKLLIFFFLPFSPHTSLTFGINFLYDSISTNLIVKDMF